jgi:hypothetical protein
MEPITLIAFVSIPLVVASVALIVRRKVVPSAAEIARKRATKRTNERAFADTTSEHDPHGCSIEFANDTTSTDAFNSHGVPLDPEQMSTINRIFGGMYSQPAHRPTHLKGTNATSSGGVPMKETAFDKLNTVSGDNPGYLEPGYQWPEKYNRE